MPVIEEVNLLPVLHARSGNDTLTQEWLDTMMPEMMAYLIAGPARCKRNVWLSWDDLPLPVQAVLVGVFARLAAQGGTNIVMEVIGDYSIRYSDPALFEGKTPRWFNDGEELALSRLAGCGGVLRNIAIPGIPVIDVSNTESDWAALNPPKSPGT